MTTFRDETGESNGSNPSASSVSHEEVNRPADGVVNPHRESVNPNLPTGVAAMPLVRSGVAGARGWMDGAGVFLAGPYAGLRMVDFALGYAEQGWHIFQMRQGS
jgi:hypothetical protein